MQYLESVDNSTARKYEIAAEKPPYFYRARKDRKRILLVEDCKHTQELLTHMLQKLGVSVIVAGDGEQFMEHAFASETIGEPFDLVLLDINLPKLNGLKAARLLRKAGFDKPIIAITAGPSLYERRESIHSGCDSFLAKSQLNATLPPLLQQYIKVH